MAENPYACPDCEGEGEKECYACGQEAECECCDGTGLDDSRMDVKAFTKAHNALLRTGGTYEWRIDGKAVGRRNRVTGIAYAAFSLNPAEREAAPKPPYHDPAQLPLFG